MNMILMSLKNGYINLSSPNSACPVLTALAEDGFFKIADDVKLHTGNGFYASGS